MFLFLVLALPTSTISRSYKGLNSSTLQTISDYKLLSTSAQGTSVQARVRGKWDSVYSSDAAADNRGVFKVRLQWHHYLIQIQ